MWTTVEGSDEIVCPLVLNILPCRDGAYCAVLWYRRQVWYQLEMQPLNIADHISKSDRQWQVLNVAHTLFNNFLI